MHKNLRKQLQAVDLSQKQAQIVEKFWKRFETTGQTLLTFVISASKLLLRILEISFEETNSQNSIPIYNIIRQLIHQLRNENIFQIQNIKIKIFLVTIRHPQINTQSTLTLKKVRLFIEALETNDFFPLIQEDFYSQVENLYIEAAKLSLREGCCLQALKYAKMSFGCIKRQFNSLVQLREVIEQPKLKQTIQKKAKTLQIIFYIEYVARLASSEDKSQQILSSIFPAYEILFQKGRFDFYSEQILAKARDITKADQEINHQLCKSQQGKIIKEQNSSQPVYKLSQSNQKKSYGQNICLQLVQSLKFIENLQASSKAESKLSQYRTSIQIYPQEQLTKRDANNKTTKQSRFSYGHQQKSVKDHEIYQKKCQEKRNLEKQCQVHQGRKAAVREQRFSMVIRAEQKSRERLKSFNPFRQSNIQNINHVATNNMIKSGIVAFGRLA